MSQEVFARKLLRDNSYRDGRQRLRVERVTIPLFDQRARGEPKPCPAEPVLRSWPVPSPSSPDAR